MSTYPLLFAAVTLAISLAASPAQTATQAPDPCALLSQAELVAVMGEIKGEPASKDGLRGKKCSYNNMKGAWVSIEIYSAEAHWDLMKNLALDVQEVKGLGDDAFSAKRGETRQVYVKKGTFMIEVDSSAGMEAAQKAAAAAVQRLP